MGINSGGAGDRSRERRISDMSPLGVFLEAELSSWGPKPLNPAISAKHAPYYIKRAKNWKNGEAAQKIFCSKLCRKQGGVPIGDEPERVSCDAMHDRACRLSEQRTCRCRSSADEDGTSAPQPKEILSDTGTSGDSAVADRHPHNDIRLRIYEIYVQREQQPSRAMDDGLQAEREWVPTLHSARCTH